MSVQVDKLQLQEESTEQWISRIVTRKNLLVITAIAVVISLFHIYTGLFGALFAITQRSIHFAMLGTLTLLVYPISKKHGDSVYRWIADLILMGLLVAVVFYLNYYLSDIIDRAGLPVMPDIILGIVAVFLVLEISRRTIGWPLVVITLLFITYIFVGPYLPDLIAHRGYSLNRFVMSMFMGGDGIWGLPLGVSATFVYLFILFGCFLRESGMGIFILKLAYACSGRFRGGPAITAVVASFLMGSISGSSTANAATTGSFTIPLMRKTGYKPEFAAAIEAGASTGGTIMPPIMGAAAFIMVALTGIPYTEIMAAALIPATVFFISVAASAYLYARRVGLKPINREEIPCLKEAFKEGFHLLVPIGILIYMLVQGYSPTYSASISVILILIVSSLRSHTRMKLSNIVRALSDGAHTMLYVMAACACAGVIMSALNLTGLGLRLSSLIGYLAGGELLFGLFLMMIASLILGMGLPVGASYVVLAIVGAPALIQLGLPLITAHMFLIFFTPFSALTPPVMITTFTTAAIAGANPWRTVRLAIVVTAGGWLIPYMFAYHPSILGIGSPGLVLATAFTAVIGVVFLSAGLQGFLFTRASLIERALLIVGALLLIDASWTTNLVGLGLIVSVILWQVLAVKKGRKTARKADTA